MPLKRLIGGLVVVSAAILVVLVAGRPAVAATTSATSSISGESSGTSTGTSDVTSSGPTLHLSTSQAAPGETITVSGDGYGQCTDPDSLETWVRLLGGGSQLADATGSGGSFSVQVSVPANAAEGDYTVAAECYNPSTGETTSGILASEVLTVAKPASPTLRLSTSQAAPGETITVSGDGYGQCTDSYSLETSVRLLGGGSQLADATGSGGSFSVQVSVPANAAEGDYTVAAECYNPSTGETTSGILASEVLTVTSAGQDNGSSGQSASKGAPIALISGIGGGAGLAILFVLWALTSHVRKRHRQVRWVREHLRAVAGSSVDPPSAEIRHRPGAKSVSLGLEPHGDHLGNQKIKEVAR